MGGCQYRKVISRNRLLVPHLREPTVWSLWSRHYIFLVILLQEPLLAQTSRIPDRALKLTETRHWSQGHHQIQYKALQHKAHLRFYRKSKSKHMQLQGPHLPEMCPELIEETEV